MKTDTFQRETYFGDRNDYIIHTDLKNKVFLFVPYKQFSNGNKQNSYLIKIEYFNNLTFCLRRLQMLSVSEITRY